MEKEYDYIFLDTPPSSPFTDAAVLSTTCDGVIMVISSGLVDSEVIKYTIKQFKNVNANILGIVLNNLDIKSRTNYNYYYYNYMYRYYYGDDLTDKEKKKLQKQKKKKGYTYGSHSGTDDDKKREFIEFLNNDNKETDEE